MEKDDPIAVVTPASGSLPFGHQRPHGERILS